MAGFHLFWKYYSEDSHSCYVRTFNIKNFEPVDTSINSQNTKSQATNCNDLQYIYAYNLYSSPNIILLGILNKEESDGETSSTHGFDEKCIQNVRRKTWSERPHRRSNYYGRIVLTWILKIGYACGLDSAGLG